MWPFMVTPQARLAPSNACRSSDSSLARPKALPTRSGVLLPSAWIAAERREAERREAEIRQRESFTTHPRLQVDDDCQITFGDAPLLQSRLPIPLHMIPNAECYVGRGGRLCYGTPSEPDSSDSDSGGDSPLLRNARPARAPRPEMSVSQAMNTSNAQAHVPGISGVPPAVDPRDIIVISDDEEDVAGASAPAAAVDPPDIIIISDDEDERRAISGGSHPVDRPGIIIISDEEDEQLAAVVRSHSIIVPHGDDIMAGAHDFQQDSSARHVDTVISSGDVVNSSADEPVQVLTGDTAAILHYAEAEVVSAPMPRSQTVHTELMKSFDRLTLSEFRMLQHRRVPFLRRNVRRGFFIRCEKFGRDVTPAPCLDGHIAVDYKYYHWSGPHRETGPYQIYHGSMLDWSCPLCNMHLPFPNRDILSFHLGNDHKPVRFNWTDHGPMSVSYPPCSSMVLSLMRL